jgi:hypothetical protein
MIFQFLKRLNNLIYIMVKNNIQQQATNHREIVKRPGQRSRRKNYLSKKENKQIRNAQYRKNKIEQIDKYFKIKKDQIYGDPLYETNFKMIFNQSYPDIVSNFISSLSNNIMVKSDTLKELNPSLYMNSLYDVASKVDILYESGHDLFILEVQRKKFMPYGKRLQHYASKGSFLKVIRGVYNYYNCDGNVFVLSIHKQKHFQDNIVDFERVIGLTDLKHYKI